MIKLNKLMFYIKNDKKKYSIETKIRKTNFKSTKNCET